MLTTSFRVFSMTEALDEAFAAVGSHDSGHSSNDGTALRWTPIKKVEHLSEPQDFWLC